MSKKEQGVEKSTKIPKLVEDQSIEICFEVRNKGSAEPPLEK